MNKLVLKAKGFTVKRDTFRKWKATEEDLGLAIAYLMGEVSGQQLRYAKDGKLRASGVTGWVYRTLAYSVRQGWLKVK